MKATRAILSIITLATTSHAALITAPPGPDDQGGMLMPMVTITATAGGNTDPTAGFVNIIPPSGTPVLKSTQQWVPGSWYAEDAAWRADLSSPAGVGGTPAANAGSGSLFNNQYGFLFSTMSGMTGNVPNGNALAIRLDSVSSPELQSFNYGNAANRWDQVFVDVDFQVLWSGSMWHNYFTMPASTPAGSYSATFEIFVADAPFTGTTGFAQYDSAALAAARNANFTPAFVTYNFDVIPEPTSGILLGLGIGSLLVRRRR
ncbi:MAG: PEP-CTERM sorting domain-containing protein [Akkermansiaceae bacterium]